MTKLEKIKAEIGYVEFCKSGYCTHCIHYSSELKNSLSFLRKKPKEIKRRCSKYKFAVKNLYGCNEFEIYLKEMR